MKTNHHTQKEDFQIKAKKTEDSINREIEHLEIKLRQKKNELAKIKKEIEKQEDRHRDLEKCASEFIEHISCELNLYDPPFFEDGLVVRDGLPEANENSPALEDCIYLAGVKNAEGAVVSIPSTVLRTTSTRWCSRDGSTGNG